MKSTRKSIAMLAALALLLSPAALADSITFTGTVTASETCEVYAPIGGKVQAVNGDVGDRVSADTVLVELSTTKVCAEEDGTVTGVFGQPGDSAETVSSLYGSVVSIEGGSVYSIAASTTNAYNTTATKFVHVGENVSLSFSWCWWNRERVSRRIRHLHQADRQGHAEPHQPHRSDRQRQHRVHRRGPRRRGKAGRPAVRDAGRIL